MISIVIPIYNEAQNIESLVNEIFDSLTKYKGYELILVNDFSNDNTKDVVRKLQNDFKILLLNNSINSGQSFSIHRGIKESTNNIIVTLDGDGQNNPHDIPKLLDSYISNTNISLVGGIRSKRKDSFIKIFSSKIANKIRSKILQDGCVDTGCSLKVFNRQYFLQFPYFNGMHRFLPALFSGYGHKTIFINVDHRARVKGYSKYGTIDRLYRGIIDIIRVRSIIKKHNQNS